jgi:hypothetical protein
MAITTAMRTEVSQLYVALFGRAPDGEGLGYWVQLRDQGQTLAQIANTMYATTPARTYFPNFLTNGEIIAAFYTNVLGRTADSEGATFWTTKLNATGATPGSVIAEMISVVANYTGTDAAGVISKDLFNNKVSVAQYYGEKNGTAAGATAALTGVTNVAATVTAAKTNIDNGVIGGVNQGTTTALSTAADNVVGTNGNDTFNGSITYATGVAANTSTMTVADKINGGLGTDTLNVVLDGSLLGTGNPTNLAAADVSGVEKLYVRQLAASGNAADTVVVNASNLPGVTEVWSDRSTGNKLVVDNLASGSAIGVQGNGAASVTNVDANFVATATVANVALAGGTAAAGNTTVVTVTGAALTTLNITGSGSGTTTINGIATGAATKTVNVDAQSNIATGNITGVAAATTVNVKGAGTANIGTLAANVSKLDANTATGAVTAVLNAATDISVTGGAGSDVFTTGAVLAGTGLVDAGAGTGDRLVVAASAHITADAGKLYKGFEQLQVSDGVTVAVSQLATNNTIDTIRINDAGGATGVTGLSAAQSAKVSILAGNAAGAITIGLSNATVGGQIDTVTAAVTTTTTAGAAQAVDLTGIILDGIEKLVLTGTGTAAATTGAITLTTTAATALDSITLTNVAAGNIITIAAGQTATNLSVDASGSGSSTINAAAYNTTTGATLKAGAGQDVVSGSVKVDTITGGAGNDVISGDGAVTVGTAATATTIAIVSAGTAANAAGDILSGGAGRDVFAFAPGAGNTLANMDSISDLELGGNALASGVDMISFDGTAGAAVIVTLSEAQQTSVTGQASLAAAVDAVLAIAATGNNAATFTYGGNNYLVINGATANATYTAAEDLVVKITGVTGTLDASDISIV